MTSFSTNSIKSSQNSVHMNFDCSPSERKFFPRNLFTKFSRDRFLEDARAIIICGSDVVVDALVRMSCRNVIKIKKDAREECATEAS